MIFNQLGTSTNPQDDVFDAVNMQRITPSEDIRELCKKNGGLSKSAGFVELTISRKNKSESFIFATALEPKDITLCE